MLVLRRFALLLTVLLSAQWRAAGEAEVDHASYNLGVIYENGRGRSGSVAGGGVGSLTDGTSQPFESAAAAAWSRGRHADGWRGSGRAPIGRRRQTEATHLPRLTPPPPGSPSNIPGVKKDEAAAVRFYMKAAEDGHAESQYKMGIMKER